MGKEPMDDLNEAVQKYPDMFQDLALRQHVAQALRVSGAISGATCTSCGQRSRIDPVEHEHFVIPCDRCGAKMGVDLTMAVTSTLLHSLKRIEAFRASGKRLLRLAERLHQDEPGS